jgi:hypothetical protein
VKDLILKSLKPLNEDSFDTKNINLLKVNSLTINNGTSISLKEKTFNRDLEFTNTDTKDIKISKYVPIKIQCTHNYEY